MAFRRIARLAWLIALVGLSGTAQSQAQQAPLIDADTLELMKAGKHARAAERMTPVLAMEFAQGFAKRRQSAVSRIYLRSAAFRRWPPAQLQLAQVLAAYDACCGTDLVEAYAWLHQLPDADAASLKAGLESQLSETELRDALGRAQELTRRLGSDDRAAWTDFQACVSPADQPQPEARSVCAYRCDTLLEYPQRARRVEVTGTVVLDVRLNIDGSVASTNVRQSAGPSREHKLLDRASADFIGSCRFLTQQLDPATTYQVQHRWVLR